MAISKSCLKIWCVVSTICLAVLAGYYLFHYFQPAPTIANDSSDGIVEIASYNDSLSEYNFTIVSRSEWLANPPVQQAGILQTPAPLVIISQTFSANCQTRETCITYVKTVQTRHVETNGWWDIGYNFLVGGDGSVYEGRGWGAVGAHTKKYNTKSIGIAFIGIFDFRLPSLIQINATKNLIALGVEMGQIAADYMLLGHRQISQSTNPGDALYEDIKTWDHWKESLV